MDPTNAIVAFGMLPALSVLFVVSVLMLEFGKRDGK